MSRRDTIFPSEYGSWIPNSRGCQIPYDTGLFSCFVLVVVSFGTVSFLLSVGIVPIITLSAALAFVRSTDTR